MNFSQLPQLEIAGIYENILSYFKRKKFRFIIIYFFLVFYLSIPSFQIPVLQYNTFRVTSLMEQRAFENFLLSYPEQSWSDIDDVNPNLLRAIISMEDGSFFRHKGIDWKELNTSLRVNKRRGRSVRGGSTITMQTAKNIYLNNIINTGKLFLSKFINFTGS